MQKITFTQTNINPDDLAKEASQEIFATLKQEAETRGILSALQTHYDTLNKSQEMYIDYLTELVQKLKETQNQDKTSLSNLKKEVLRHILDTEKAKK